MGLTTVKQMLIIPALCRRRGGTRTVLSGVLKLIMKDSPLTKKIKMERLSLIKERYRKLVVRQRQEIEREIQDDFRHDEEFDAEVPVETVADEVEE